jgi:curved DNA-binding protein CbpA
MGDDDFNFADMIADEVGTSTETDEAPPSESGPQAAFQTLAARIQGSANAFEVLGVPQDADEEHIRSAYTELARHLHPDAFSGDSAEQIDLANEVFDKVRAAWDKIDTAEKRQKHIDHVILGKPTEDEEAMETVRAYMDAEASFKKGRAAFNAGRISAAHALFSSAHDNVPDELEFRVYLAYTTFNLNRKQDPVKANDALEQLKDLLDENLQQERRLDGGWVLLGRAYRETGQHEAAKKCLVQALRISTANPDVTRELRRLESAKEEAEHAKKGLFGKLFGRSKKKPKKRSRN